MSDSQLFILKGSECVSRQRNSREIGEDGGQTVGGGRLEGLYPLHIGGEV